MYRPSMRMMIPWAAVAALLAAAPVSPAAEEGFEKVFDGKTLEGWDGNPEFWRVEDGAITGQTTKEKPTKGNTFIIWRGGKLGDFELKLEYRIFGGNSGIQYRSFEPKGTKWVVGGYQADFEAGDNWSGANYGERFRGILAKRGDKTVIGEDHKPKVVGSVGDRAGLQKHINKEDWNEYHITAKGYHFVHRINGQVMSEVVDEDEKMRRDSGILALQLHAGPPMKVQFRNIRIKHLGKQGGNQGDGGCQAKGKAGSQGEKKKVVFVAGRPSHGYGAHEHNAGCLLLADTLERAMPNFETVVYRNGWPKEKDAFEGADSIVMYCDGGGRHMVNPHLEQVDKLMDQGVGVVCIHYAVEVPKGKSGDAFLDWIGGYFETHWSVNPHWTAKFDKFPDHPIAQGVEPFEINDEWYYHMRFRPGMKGVTPILSDLPPAQTLRRPDGAHSGNPHVREAVLKRKEPQHVAWAAERPDGGRGFGFTGGHVHWNWGDDNFRKTVLNAIVWTAHGEVPQSGVETKTPSQEDLEANQDYAKPGEKKQDSKKKPAKKPVKKSAAGSSAKPKFASDVVTSGTEGHAVDVEVDIRGAEQLFLVVDDGGNGYSCDWADWIEPRLVGPGGEKKLTDLKWKQASSAWGSVQVHRNCQGQPLRVDGKEAAYGIGTHANSVIAYDLPAGFTHFKAHGGLDHGGVRQQGGNATSVRFYVFTEPPPARYTSPSRSGGGDSGSRDADEALAGLDVAEGLEATLFASEPDILSVANLDIDHRGRIWVVEIVNYRHNNGKRPEGDRILILEDTDQDGVADKQKVYYQGRDIDTALGICVLGNQTIVSVAPNVFVFTDEDGDDKPDKKEKLFTKVGQPQHDHSTHSFVFGPDGKYYWNVGNTGRAVHDKDGNLVVDTAGNQVVANGKPYREGMVFRCNPDGSEFEVLGHNFRNNYEATVDSFGTIWQSDNDDDGNRGVRINYVMEYGNYGYKDEITGAGWKQKRTGWHPEVPLRHWHQNDPGVVPNLLQTGAGSPTGITCYEGELLPEVFHGQVLHTDAGPNVARAYPVTKHGAGYKAGIVDILHGARDKWFRPADVAVAPDGSIFITDWYDPGVGGHRQGDLDRGRIFRVAPPGAKYRVPQFDFASVAGAVEALKNPCYSVRYLAWTSLHAKGEKAEAELAKLFESDNPHYRARALWLLGKIEGRGQTYVEAGLGDEDPDIRITAIRLARQLQRDLLPIVAKLTEDPSPQVRRECAIALRGNSAPRAAELWAELAAAHDGKDRWYLEALGIGAAGQWDAFLGAWLQRVGENWNTPAGRDIIWRSRATVTPRYLAKIVTDPKIPTQQHARYMRAFDFQSGPEKEKALKAILGL